MEFAALRAETQLLICCARADASAQPANAQRIRELLSTPPDWEWIHDAAARHNLTPLLFSNLQRFSAECGRTLIPPEALLHLRDGFQIGAARNFCLTSQLLEILAVFKSRGILALAYKGPALAVAAYGNPLLRSFCDLDLLLRPADMARAGECLSQIGFVQTVHAGDAANDYAQQWEKSDGGVVVELHWDILARHQAVPLELGTLWHAPTTLQIGGAEILAPAREELLLLLSWHGYKHRWGVLEWIAAVAELILNDRKEEIHWPRLLEKSARTGSRRVLFLTLSLVHELFDVPLPADVCMQLQQDTGVGKLTRQIYSSLFPECVGLAMGGAFYHLRSRERLRDKARYVWRLAQTPGELSWK